jgi:hypothetical protein
MKGLLILVHVFSFLVLSCNAFFGITSMHRFQACLKRGACNPSTRKVSFATNQANIENISVYVKNLPKSKLFYEKVLSLAPKDLNSASSVGFNFFWNTSLTLKQATTFEDGSYDIGEVCLSILSMLYCMLSYLQHRVGYFCIRVFMVLELKEGILSVLPPPL